MSMKQTFQFFAIHQLLRWQKAEQWDTLQQRLPFSESCHCYATNPERATEKFGTHIYQPLQIISSPRDVEAPGGHAPPLSLIRSGCCPCTQKGACSSCCTEHH